MPSFLAGNPKGAGAAEPPQNQKTNRPKRSVLADNHLMRYTGMMADDSVPSFTPEIPAEPTSEFPEPTPSVATESEVIVPPVTPDPVEETPVVVSSPPPPPLSAPPVEFRQELYFPFLGNFEISFGFGGKPLNDVMQKKYQDWGLVGHNGIDYTLSEETEVLACDTGKVIQSGDNGDYGNSVTISHSWGTSIYGHLKETKVSSDKKVKAGDLVGISGQSGYVTGPHLHFGIKPNDSDANNGYLGFIDPSPYLKKLTEKPLPAEASTERDQSPQPPPSPQIIERIVEKEVIKEVVKDISEEKFRARVLENQNLGNLAKKAKHDENLNRIMQVAQEKKQISNSEVRELLHVSQSTATNYLNSLVNRGMLKVDKKAKATVYTY